MSATGAIREPPPRHDDTAGHGSRPAPRAEWLLPLQTVLMPSACMAAAAFIGVFTFVALSRADFGFDMEWVEGAIADHVTRVLDRRPLYVAPSLDFVPLVYPPGYYYLSAAAALVLGPGLSTLRLVSIACSLGTFALLAWFGSRELRSWRAGLLMTGLFAASYVIGGAWLDLARVDALFLLLTMAALCVLRFGHSTGSAIALGFLLAATILTKQVALTIAPLLLLVPLLQGHRRKAAIAATVCGTATASAVLLLQWQSAGWFLHYTVFAVTATQSIWNDHLVGFWTADLLGSAPIATLLAAGWCVKVWRAGTRADRAFYLVLGAALIGSTWQVRLHPGAWTNTILPAYLFLAMTGVCAARALESRWPGSGAGLLLLQFALLVYNPQHLLPSRADRLAVERLRAELTAVPGDVLMLSHGHFPRTAGKRTYAHEMAIRDVFTAGGEWAARLEGEIRAAVSAQQFDLIVQDTPNWFPLPIDRYYVRTARLFRSPVTLTALAGGPGRPEYLYEPRGRPVERLSASTHGE